MKEQRSKIGYSKKSKGGGWEGSGILSALRWAAVCLSGTEHIPSSSQRKASRGHRGKLGLRTDRRGFPQSHTAGSHTAAPLVRNRGDETGQETLDTLKATQMCSMGASLFKYDTVLVQLLYLLCKSPQQ